MASKINDLVALLATIHEYVKINDEFIKVPTKEWLLKYEVRKQVLTVI